jgi:hypothetical protein
LLADEWTKKKKAGQVQGNGSGFGGKGFKFNKEEQEKEKRARKVGSARCRPPFHPRAFQTLVYDKSNDVATLPIHIDFMHRYRH